MKCLMSIRRATTLMLLICFTRYRLFSHERIQESHATTFATQRQSHISKRLCH
jgi:hypothetical protein